MKTRKPWPTYLGLQKKVKKGDAYRLFDFQ